MKSILTALLIFAMLCSGCATEDVPPEPIEEMQVQETVPDAKPQPVIETTTVGENEKEPMETPKAQKAETQPAKPVSESSAPAQTMPSYNGGAYKTINGNVPLFTQAEKAQRTVFESYSPLDGLGRCGAAYALLGRETMPTQERGSIGQVKPSGWHTVRYDNVDGKYLYNRCHLIGYQLSAENANTKNLITGTRYLNVEGMLPFENMVADYIKETGNHVLYRVSPVFEGSNLLASGVYMEAYSVEDGGSGICFNVYCYNVQPGIVIDYADGSSYAQQAQKSEEKKSQPIVPVPTAPQSSAPSVTESAPQSAENKVASTYVLNLNTKKFHYADCRSVKQMKESNKEYSNQSRDEIVSRGFSPCGNCHP
ncbi:MAG: DNA/RNA non-specific endonuclease [Clostridia bacterium]|nr:DNA/RNA non-specific endonuclease [Clostridia bacterium]